jgi:hypothetical protein
MVTLFQENFKGVYEPLESTDGKKSDCSSNHPSSSGNSAVIREDFMRVVSLMDMVDTHGRPLRSPRATRIKAVKIHRHRMHLGAPMSECSRMDKDKDMESLPVRLCITQATGSKESTMDMVC